jgi:hypothetical protein
LCARRWIRFLNIDVNICESCSYRLKKIIQIDDTKFLSNITLWDTSESLSVRYLVKVNDYVEYPITIISYNLNHPFYDYHYRGESFVKASIEDNFISNYGWFQNVSCYPIEQKIIRDRNWFKFREYVLLILSLDLISDVRKYLAYKYFETESDIINYTI